MSDWQPGRWWRVVRDVKFPVPTDLWCETSDEQEARHALIHAPWPARLENLWTRTEKEWRRA